MDRCFRWFHAVVALLWCILGASLLARPVAAQDVPPTSSEDLRFRPLADALIELQTVTGIDLFYDSDLIRRKWTPVQRSETLAEAPAAEVLQGLLTGTGLYSYRLSSGTYAIKAIDPATSPPGSLAGTVFDRSTGEPLANANLVLVTDARGTATDASGSFSFRTLAPGRYYIHISHIGYQALVDTITVIPLKTTRLRFDLIPRPIPILPIIVEGIQLGETTGVQEALLLDEPMPMSGLGTQDAVRDLNNLMGVRTGDATADIHIQGGEAGEHQFRLDGVPVFEPVHLRGLLGAFNPFALERITVHKAGFGVSEGSQIAGVITAEHALASPDGRLLDVQVDPLSLNGRIHLTAGNPHGTRGQLMAAARQSLWSLYAPSQLDSLLQSWNNPDLFLTRASLIAFQEELRLPANLFFNTNIPDSFSVDPDARPDLGFTDIHAAGRLQFGGSNSINASFYRGTNHLSARRFYAPPDSAEVLRPSLDAYDWGNTNAQARYQSLLNSRAFWTTRIRGNQYDLSHTYLSIDNDSTVSSPINIIPTELEAVDDGNRIRELALESTLDIAFGPSHTVNLGIEAARTAHRFHIDDVFLRPMSNSATNLRAAVFAEEKAVLGNFTLVAGTRFTYINQQRTVYAEPRAEVRYDATRTGFGAFSGRIATGLYRQFVNQFDISSVSPSALLPGVRFWMPVDASVAPPKAYHLATELLLGLTSAWSLRSEAYYKHQPHILSIDYPGLFDRTREEIEPVADEQEEFLRHSEGYAYGAALGLERTGARLRTSARYEYNLARREYAFKDSLRYEPVPWNEPHQFNLALDWSPTQRLITTARWHGAWGRAWGYRKAYYDYLATDPQAQAKYGRDPETGEFEIDFLQPSAHQLPAFIQLDMGAAYTRTIGAASIQVRFDILNVLDRDNVADWTLATSEGEDNTINYKKEIPRTTLPRTVSLGIRLKL